jgi:hypothetical protein
MNITLKSEEDYHDYIKRHKTTPDNNELYCMHIYLKHLLIHKIFPIHIKTERECPDFVLQIRDFTIGLEHTRASCQALTYGEKKLEDYPEGSMLEVPDCQHIKASKESIKEVIRKPGEPLQSIGWGDRGKEKFLIESILNSIKEKTKKLNQNYEIYHSNELIIYDNISILCMRWDYVMSELKKQYTKTNSRNFDKIHLIVKNELCYDIMSKCD